MPLLVRIAVINLICCSMYKTQPTNKLDFETAQFAASCDKLEFLNKRAIQIKKHINYIER